MTTEPSRPTAADGRWMIATTVSLAAATAIVVTIYITMLTNAITTTWLAPRIMQLAIYLLAIATGAVVVMAHIDRRVSEAASRGDRRMDAIANGMIEHGIQLDDTTGEIAKVRVAFEGHTHPVQSGGYDRGYSDGLAAAKVQRVSGRASVIDPDVIDMATRLQNRMDQ